MNKGLIKRLFRDYSHYDVASSSMNKDVKYEYGDNYIYMSPYRIYVTNKCYDEYETVPISKNVRDYINTVHDREHLLTPLKINRTDLEEKYKEVKILKGDFWAETYKIKTKYGNMGFNIKFLRDLLDEGKTDTVYITDLISPVFNTNNLSGEFGMILPKRCH